MYGKLDSSLCDMLLVLSFRGMFLAESTDSLLYRIGSSPLLSDGGVVVVLPDSWLSGRWRSDGSLLLALSFV